MVDVQAAVLSFLEASSGLTGVRIVAGQERPPKGYDPAQGELIVFKARGGTHSYEADHLFPSMQFKCYASTERDSFLLYIKIFDALNFQGGAGVKYAEEETIGQTLREPDTDWPFTLAFFNVTIAN